MILPEPLTNILAPMSSSQGSSPDLSIVTKRATVLDVCYSVYGESALSTDDVDNFYETSASKSSVKPEIVDNYNSLYSSVSSYRADRG
jgi:hypothetical protein